MAAYTKLHFQMRVVNLEQKDVKKKNVIVAVIALCVANLYVMTCYCCST